MDDFDKTYERLSELNKRPGNTKDHVGQWLEHRANNAGRNVLEKARDRMFAPSDNLVKSRGWDVSPNNSLEAKAEQDRQQIAQAQQRLSDYRETGSVYMTPYSQRPNTPTSFAPVEGPTGPSPLADNLTAVQEQAQPAAVAVAPAAENIVAPVEQPQPQAVAAPAVVPFENTGGTTPTAPFANRAPGPVVVPFENTGGTTPTAPFANRAPAGPTPEEGSPQYFFEQARADGLTAEEVARGNAAAQRMGTTFDPRTGFSRQPYMRSQANRAPAASMSAPPEFNPGQQAALNPQLRNPEATTRLHPGGAGPNAVSFVGSYAMPDGVTTMGLLSDGTQRPMTPDEIGDLQQTNEMNNQVQISGGQADSLVPTIDPSSGRVVYADQDTAAQFAGQEQAIRAEDEAAQRRFLESDEGRAFSNRQVAAARTPTAYDRAGAERESGISFERDASGGGGRDSFGQAAPADRLPTGVQVALDTPASQRTPEQKTRIALWGNTAQGEEWGGEAGYQNRKAREQLELTDEFRARDQDRRTDASRELTADNAELNFGYDVRRSDINREDRREELALRDQYDERQLNRRTDINREDRREELALRDQYDERQLNRRTEARRDLSEEEEARYVDRAINALERVPSEQREGLFNEQLATYDDQMDFIENEIVAMTSLSPRERGAIQTQVRNLLAIDPAVAVADLREDEPELFQNFQQALQTQEAAVLEEKRDNPLIRQRQRALEQAVRGRESYLNQVRQVYGGFVPQVSGGADNFGAEGQSSGRSGPSYDKR